MLLDASKAALRAAGVQPPKDVPLRDVDPSFKLRRVPVSRLTARLGINQYKKTAPMDEETVIAPRSVKILLSQHIGAPAAAVVKKGDTVEKGQLVAAAADGKLSVNIHSSMNGTVKEVTDKFIWIEK